MPGLRRAALAALIALGLAAPAAARPFTVDDLLRQEAFGAAAVDPGGRWLVLERRGPYETAGRFDQDQDNATATSRLFVADLAHPAPARRLLAPAEAPGQVLGPFSPSGTRLAVYRLRQGRWTLGVATLGTGRVRWFAVTPELSLFGRTLQWVSDRELLVLDRPDGTPSWLLRLGHASADALPALWRASASGVGAHTVLGSGAYRGLRARPAPLRLLRLDVTTGAAATLATADFSDLELSPDRRRVALRETGEDLQPRAGAPVQGDWGVALQAERLSLLDLADGRRRPVCPGCDVLAQLLAWSPDSRSLLVYARGPDAPWSAGALRRIGAAGGGVETLGAGLRPLIEGRPEGVRAGWMGADPVVLARPAGPADARLDWYRLTRAGPVNLTAGLTAAPRALAALDPGGLTALADRAAFRIDPAGRATRLPADGVEDARGPRLTVQGRLYFAPPAGSWTLTAAPGAAATPARPGPRLQRLDARGLSAPLDLPAGAGEVIAASPLGPAAVLRRRDPRGVETLSLVRPGAAPRALAQVNADFAALDPPEVRAVAHRGPDGQPLTSWLFLPPRHAGAPPPLVVKPYSGNVYAAPPRDPPPVLGLASDVRVLVGHGYAVLVPSLPLPKARGEPMAGLAGRISAVVDAAAADPALAGAFDPGRIALWGHSYGGYTVMAAIGQSDRFRAAVSVAGPSDLLGKWAALPAAHRVMPEAGVRTAFTTGSVETAQGGMGAPPWADPARYARNSPLLAADRIHTPLLLIHGDQDAVPLAQAEAMFSALYRQGKDAVLVTYWGEGHYIASPGNVRDLYARAFAFLDARFTAPATGGPAASAASPAPAPASGAPRPRPPPP